LPPPPSLSLPSSPPLSLPLTLCIGGIFQNGTNRAYPWISSKYVSVCKCVSVCVSMFVPLQIVWGVLCGVIYYFPS
jgi:hypothetical protein